MAPRAPTKATLSRQQSHIPPIEWQTLKGLHNAFPPSTGAENEVRDVMEFSVVGKVANAFLQAHAFTHTLVLDIAAVEIETIKTIARSAPRHNEANYRWPFDGTVTKFTTKDDLSNAFQNVWDGRNVVDISDIEQRHPLGIDDVEEGDEVMVEYTITPYSGRKPKGTDPGFEAGCSLKLLSVGVLEKHAGD
jgi:hypothetical protein